MSFGAIKRTPLDAAFSKLVRMRVGWICEVQSCQRYFPEGRARMGLHASHYWGRGRQSVRFDPRNCFSHCAHHHNEFGSHPHEFHQWTWVKLGPVVYDELLARAQTPLKRSKADKADLLKEMKSELKRMEDLRKQGVIDRIPFTLEGITW